MAREPLPGLTLGSGGRDHPGRPGCWRGPGGLDGGFDLLVRLWVLTRQPGRQRRRGSCALSCPCTRAGPARRPPSVRAPFRLLRDACGAPRAREGSFPIRPRDLNERRGRIQRACAEAPARLGVPAAGGGLLLVPWLVFLPPGTGDFDGSGLLAALPAPASPPATSQAFQEQVFDQILCKLHTEARKDPAGPPDLGAGATDGASDSLSVQSL